ncbi:hypothetical protein ABG768_015980 [Culter alburnus]|uniref:Uncharacterized protein n=1 Tax=Culter alburnus TaxID=194366 RepID=A0AAW1Z0W3_CULAL
MRFIHYPTVIRKGISNGWKLQIKEEEEDSDVMITVNLYKNGTVMIEGNLKQFEKDFLQIKGKGQLNKISPNTLKQAEDTSTSTHQSTKEQSRDDSEEISLLHSIINDMKEKFREMELKLVQLREEVHGVAQETDRTERKEDYRKEIAMLKKEIQELKNQNEEYNKQVSVMREEMRGLREDREPAAFLPSHSHEHQQEQHPDSQSYAEAVSRSLIHSNTSTVDSQQASSPFRDLRNIQHMLTLLCSHLMG